MSTGGRSPHLPDDTDPAELVDTGDAPDPVESVDPMAAPTRDSTSAAPAMEPPD